MTLRGKMRIWGGASCRHTGKFQKTNVENDFWISGNMNVLIGLLRCTCGNPYRDKLFRNWIIAQKQGLNKLLRITSIVKYVSWGPNFIDFFNPIQKQGLPGYLVRVVKCHGFGG